ncbi:MAG: PEGA domain protein [Methanoregula sp. PtaU1.Bin051]|nr:MAG: PEGA domain protein [Methanoregula sp. PtaU1.Bin051]
MMHFNTDRNKDTIMYSRTETERSTSSKPDRPDKTGTPGLQIRRSPGWIILAAIIILCPLLSGTAVAESITAPLGDTVELSGYSYGSMDVYLFLTGPNLPVNGAAINDITFPADQGGLVRVPVDSTGRWSYDWATNAIIGGLDEGTYTVWVSTVQADRSRLRSGEYSTLSVTLRRPALALATTAPLPGTIEVRSVPEGASVVIGDQYKGQTPLSIDNLDPGTYALTISHFRYDPISVSATVRSGSTTVVNAILIPSVGSLAISSSPAGARVLIDGNVSVITPATIDGLSAGNHSVTVQLDGYATVQKSVTVVAGQNTSVSIVLESAGPAGPSATRAGTPLPLPVLFLSAVIFLMGITLLHRWRK